MKANARLSLASFCKRFPLAIDPPTNLIAYVTTSLQLMQANFHCEALAISLGVLNLGESVGESCVRACSSAVRAGDS